MKSTILTLIFIYCSNAHPQIKEAGADSRFEVDFQWSFINFTWESREVYQDAIDSGRYIPENNAMTGIKFYKDKVYIAMPRIRTGTPVTLGYVTRSENTPQENPLIEPFPHWAAYNQDETGCNRLISIQSMEIDADGILWVLDGHRSRNNAGCPSKLILYDLNRNNEIIETYDFPETVTLSSGGFLNDLVVDSEDGGYAYITDHSNISPGLVVYSRASKSSWKLQDASMFAEPDAAHFTVAEMSSDGLAPLDGIALSPVDASSRYVYYCALTGYSLFAVSTDILKSESTSSGGNWRFDVKYLGAKQAQSDGMVIDNEGNIYYGLLPLFGVGKWNINDEDFTTAEIVDVNNSTMIWTDSFGMDDQGYLYLLTNHVLDYFGGGQLELNDEIVFRILKLHTGTKSYLFPKGT